MCAYLFSLSMLCLSTMNFIYNLWREWDASLLSGPCSECAVIQQEQTISKIIVGPRMENVCKYLQEQRKQKRLIKVKGG